MNLKTKNSESRKSASSPKHTMTVQRKSSKDINQNDGGRFQVIFEHSPMAIMYTDKDGTITTCNDKACKLFGASRERLIGFSYKDISNQRMQKAIITALSGEISHFEGQYLTVTGNMITSMNAHFSPSFSPDGTVSGIIGIFEDISERMHAEQEKERLLNNLRKDLENAKKLTGFILICAACKRIKDDQGSWKQIEDYISAHSGMEFSHGFCPECTSKLYPSTRNR